MKRLLCMLALTGFAYCQADHYVVIAEGSSEDDDGDCNCDEHIVYEEPSQECDQCNWVRYYWDDYVEDTMERENAWPGKREDSFYDYIVR